MLCTKRFGAFIKKQYMKKLECEKLYQTKLIQNCRLQLVEAEKEMGNKELVSIMAL